MGLYCNNDWDLFQYKNKMVHLPDIASFDANLYLCIANVNDVCFIPPPRLLLSVVGVFLFRSKTQSDFGGLLRLYAV